MRKTISERIRYEADECGAETKGGKKLIFYLVMFGGEADKLKNSHK
jgi:hypothetical protein